ncbi:dihydrodipicolinate synthase family protein [Demequina litorisediminis]|uniref:dihydrodipicolinate synthase family protein n=1 Tax=Demequina litorisediminis TaxID=1849022 RepID=UPI0032AFCD62
MTRVTPRPPTVSTRSLLPVHDAIFSGPGAANAKAAMQLLGVIPGRHMRLPLLPLDDDEYASLGSALRAAGVPIP